MIGRTNTGGGGGGGLNFKVVGGTTAPSNPKENMIWINTSTAITDWAFSATQPTAVNGRVWISTGKSSIVEFNAAKKNSLQVYPISAKQYVSGAWVKKPAKSYQNGELVDWIPYLIKGASLCERVTGGWTAQALRWNNDFVGEMPILTKNSNSITLALSTTGYSCGVYYANNKIDLTDVKKLHLKGMVQGGADSDGGGVRFAVCKNIGASAQTGIEAFTWMSAENKPYELSVENLSGEYVICIQLLSGGGTVAKGTIEYFYPE